MNTSSLSPDARTRALAGLPKQDWDVVIVGGGATGAGAALDAASRGLRVLLLEKGDLASGTSSRSSKLLHGGLRYLEHLQFGLVHEALRERGLLLDRLAPHLARVTQFYLPLTKPLWERAYIGAGVLLYDVLSGLRSHVPRNRHLTRAQLRRHAADLSPAGIRGAIRYSDVQVDDARLVLDLARTASSYGATILTRCEVTDFDVVSGEVTGLRVRDLETDARYRIKARAVVNAAGPAVPAVEALAGVERPVSVAASKGVHLLVPRDAIRSDAAWICRTPTSVLFVLPWDEHWLVGTTDTPYDGDVDHPEATSSDIDYLIDQVNRFTARPISRADVVGTYVGLRPLVKPAGADPATSVISREHVIHTGMPGLISIVGGKLTTYRVMARDVIDEVVRHLGGSQKSVTARIPLVGAGAVTDRSLPTRWVSSRGALAVELSELVGERPDLADDIPGAPGVALAEIHHSVLHEGALHVEDFLERRTHIAIESRDRGSAAADRVAREMGSLLGWSRARVADERDRYRRRVESAAAVAELPFVSVVAER